jgi:Flp pilus assembly protein TadG
MKLLRRFLGDELGQALPVIALMFTALLGLGGLALDIGRALYSFEELQASTDAAALAGAQALPVSSAVATAIQYSSVSGNLNAHASLPGVTMVSGYPKVECLTTLKNQGMACSAPDNANAMHVEQTVSIPMYFMVLLGKKTLTLTASATAAMRGSSPIPYNVAIIMDTTLSMAEVDNDCGGATQMQCALNGVQVLLQSLTPCPKDETNCTIVNGVSSNSVDRVALFAFPNVTIGTSSIDTSCTTPIPSSGYYYNALYGNYSMLPTKAWWGVPTSMAYSFPAEGATSYSPSGTNNATYQITNFLSDYRTSDTATSLNPSSDLVQAAGAVNGCGSMTPPNYDGEYGTYYAGAIYAAQAALLQEQANNPGSNNVIILLSDGDSNAPQTPNGYPGMPAPATASGYYPSYNGQCSQAIIAAAGATAQGTRVYSVAYGSPQSGCSTDASYGSYKGISPCQTMADIASAPQYFFSDYTQSGSNSTCFSNEQPVSSLSAIFTQIAGDLTNGRLIPDNTP